MKVDVAHSFLTLAVCGDEGSASCPNESSLVPIKQEASWAPEPVWMLWRRKYFSPGKKYS
jgi:hypothetical protein